VTAPARVVAVVTVSRSDYGHLRPVLEAIRAAPDLRLRLIVAGMHLEPHFGLTVRAVEEDGWPIAARVPMGEDDDSPAGIAAATARGVEGFARAYAAERPDLVVVLGDRYEMLAAAVAALPFALPVAHIHGGEESEGAIDNQIRHAITKLAHLHFASADLHARHIADMGEEAWRIHPVGAPGLDRIAGTAILDRAAVAEALHLPSAGRWIVVTFHPVTLEHEATAQHVNELVAALDKVEGTLVLTYPGADTGARAITERLEDLAERDRRCHLVKSLGDRLYLSLLRHADLMVGNSSSGLIEAPSFELPAVNVGARQRGRLRGDNVVDVEPTSADILRGIDAARAPDFRARLRGRPNPYGDGQAAPRIVEVLRTVPIDARLVQKRLAQREGRR
jgi:UDP-hydrolysing UDP-N-acetyl-D-glucosamine 2-epimerase